MHLWYAGLDIDSHILAWKSNLTVLLASKTVSNEFPWKATNQQSTQKRFSTLNINLLRVFARQYFGATYAGLSANPVKFWPSQILILSSKSVGFNFLDFSGLVSLCTTLASLCCCWCIAGCLLWCISASGCSTCIRILQQDYVTACTCWISLDDCVVCKLTTLCDMVCYIIPAASWSVLDCGRNHSTMLCHCFIWSWITWHSNNDIMLGVFAGSMSHNGLGQGLEKKLQNKWFWTLVMEHEQLRFRSFFLGNGQ